MNPLISTNLVVQATATSGRAEERQHSLRVEQIVQATVVEGGLDRALLELKHQRFQILTEQELQTGQQLEMQVLTTHPRLSFKILADPLDSRFATLLPLLAKPFDWSGLLQRLQVKEGPQPEPMRQVLEQLSSMMRPVADLPVEELTSVAVTLGQLRQSDALFAVVNGPALATAFDRVLTVLSRRVEALDLPQQLKVMAMQIRQQPELMRQFMAVEQERIAGLLTELEQPPQPLQPQQARQLAAELKTLLSARQAVLPQSLKSTTQDLKILLNRPPVEDLELSPALLGHLKKLVVQLEIAAAAKPVWPQELQQVVRQVLNVMQPLVGGPELIVRGEHLGMLSQLFGLNLEAELLRGRTREALSSLKLALLGEGESLGPKGEEALQRLELFQVSRVRLAEQNLFFIPLPFSFLEEGFLLVEEQGQQKDQQKEDTDMVRMSLYLRLSALGSLRVDMLSESSGVLLRVACEDQSRATFLQSLCGQLKERLRDLPVRGISFTSGAKSPATELIEKIVPRSQGMLDARV